MSNILAVHSGALGDLVLFGRLLERLDGRVTLLAGGEKGKLLQGLGVVHRALDFDALPMHELFSDKPVGECKLPQLLGGHDRLVSCFAADDPHSRRRLTDFCGVGLADFLPIRPPPDWNSHLLDLWRAMLTAPPCGPSAEHPGQFPPWSPPASMRQRAQQTLADVGCCGKYAVIHPGAGSRPKCWPLEQFMELAATLRDRMQVIFVVGPAELDWWGQAGLKSISCQFPLLSAPPLDVLAGMLAGASLYAGNDSGVSHLAAAVGAPTIAVFGPSSSTHFAPLGQCVKIAPFTSTPSALHCWL